MEPRECQREEEGEGQGEGEGRREEAQFPPQRFLFAAVQNESSVGRKPKIG